MKFKNKPSLMLINQFNLDKTLLPEMETIGLKKLLNNYDKILSNQKVLMNLIRFNYTKKMLIKKAKLNIKQRLIEKVYIIDE